MKFLSNSLKYILLALFCSYSMQSFVIPTATADQINQIQKILDKIKDLKDKGKANDDAAIVTLANQAIVLADSFYAISDSNMDGEPTYDPNYAGDGKCSKSGKKVKVKIGFPGLASPGWLASTKMHEIVVHGGQAATDRWYTNTKGDAINELEAYDAEIDNAVRNGLSKEEIDELKKRRDAYYTSLDTNNRKKIDSQKQAGVPYHLALLPPSREGRFAFSRNSELFVAGSVLAEERMKVSVRGTRVIEGLVISTEVNGKKVNTKPDKNGNALIDFSVLTAGLVGTTVAVIKTLDSKGNVVHSVSTTVQQGSTEIFKRPTIERLPANLPNNDIVTIPGQNLGADAQIICGEQKQEVLSASDGEITVLTETKPGTQPVYVITPSGVSESQTVNVYTLNFILPKSSITAKEVVQAQVNFASLPVGTSLKFSNNSPETIKMDVPNGSCSRNICNYQVTQQNGTLPVIITGITNGTFKITMTPVFKK